MLRIPLTLRCGGSRPTFPVIGVLSVGIGLGMSSPTVHAQTQTEATVTARTLSITPELSVSQTLTDNARLSSSDRQADLITRISPTLHVRSNGGRIQGFVDYSLSGLIYAKSSASNTVQQSLNADVKAEAIENFAYLKASANISQQNISAFGIQSPDPSLRTANQTEVSTFTLEPYIKGRLANVASYDARLSYSATRSGNQTFGNSTRSGAAVRVGSDNSQARINWAVDASRDTTGFSAGRETQSDLATGSLIFSPAPEVQLTARGGRESNTIASIDRQASNTYGLGLRWTPSPRTSVSIDRDQRFFGSSHSVSLVHRTARTAWAFSDSRSVSSDAFGASRGVPLTEFDLLFLTLTSRFPDPFQRAQQALIQLQALGINPGAIAQGGFLTDAVSLQRRQDLSAALNGLRSNLILSAFKTETRRLDAISAVIDPLSAGTVIRQRGFSVALSHRLTPESTVNLITTQTRSSSSLTGATTNLLSVTSTWTSRLGERTHVSLGARHAVSDGDTAPYTESALIGTFLMNF